MCFLSKAPSSPPLIDADYNHHGSNSSGGGNSDDKPLLHTGDVGLHVDVEVMYLSSTLLLLGSREDREGARECVMRNMCTDVRDES